MLKHLLHKLLGSVMHTKHSHRRYGSSSRAFQQPRPYLHSSSRHHGYGASSGHHYYKNRRHSSS